MKRIALANLCISTLTLGLSAYIFLEMNKMIKKDKIIKDHLLKKFGGDDDTEVIIVEGEKDGD